MSEHMIENDKKQIKRYSFPDMRLFKVSNSLNSTALSQLGEWLSWNILYSGRDCLLWDACSGSTLKRYIFNRKITIQI